MRLLVLALVFLTSEVFAQTNISLSNPEVLQVLKANYNPIDYASLESELELKSYCDFIDEVNPDSLYSKLQILTSFHNRNTFSDTLSSNFGIGATRRWIMNRLRTYDDPSEPKMLFSYLDFEISNNTCGSGLLRNVLAIRPGTNPNMPISIVEAHMDSRCGGRCDVSCKAHGADDNGSGTVMVMELARVMAKNSYPGTIVFMLTTGEEQGLLGATAMAMFCEQESIPIKAVFNSDIIGGVFCGETASPPTICAGEGSIDSSRLRIFASPSEQLGSRNQARFIKLNYEKFLVNNVEVPMQIQIMNQEDRTGRGGDHIPFRQRGFNATRFTSAVEHGNGAGNSDPNYEDRQHSEDDIIGVDKNFDGIIDSSFIDFNYLARNTVINASILSFSSFADTAPSFSVNANASGGAELTILDSSWVKGEILIGVRSASSVDTSYMFDHMYSYNGLSKITVPGLNAGSPYFVAISHSEIGMPIGVWSNGQFVIPTESSTAGNEFQMNYFDCANANSRAEYSASQYEFKSMPNPSSRQLEAKIVGIEEFKIWEMRLRDIRGRNIISISQMGKESAFVNTSYIDSGLYLVQFIVDGKVLKTEKLVISH